MHNGKIWITDWNGNRHEMTPDELLERIRKDSRSNWDWLAPATEIAKTISDPEFPESIANELKSIVLKCFGELLLSNIGGTEKSTDQLAVAYCYYSIHGQTGKRIKRLYRKNLIKARTSYVSLWTPLIRGEKYRTFLNRWQKDALKHFTERFGIDFMRFGINIETDFKTSVKRAEAAGEFDEDKSEHEKTMQEIFNAVSDF